MRQTRERILKGNTHVAGKIVSLFEPHTEIIRKGKAAKPTEFGKMVKIQEAEQQIITHYEVYEERPSDAALLIPALDAHEQQLGRTPRLVTADAGFFSTQNEAAAHARGVKADRDPQSVHQERRTQEACRKSAGSARHRSGAPDAKAASVCSSDATG